MAKFYHVPSAPNKLLSWARFVLETGPGGCGLPQFILEEYTRLMQDIKPNFKRPTLAPNPAVEDLLRMVRFVFENSDGGALPAIIHVFYFMLLKDLGTPSAPMDGKVSGKVYQLSDFRG